MIVGLDIGTSFIRVAIGDVDENGNVQIAGTSVVKSDGLRNGIIVNIEAAKNAIKEAIELAEQNAGLEVTSVYTAIGGIQINSTNSHGVVGITKTRGNTREITLADVDRVIDCAKSLKFPPDRQVLHIIPQNFIVDGISSGVETPVDRMGDRLEADVHIVTAAYSTVQNVRSCIDRAGYLSNGIMLKTLASTFSVVHQDELELGSIVIDLGAGTTDVLVLLKGAPVCTASIQVGGNLVTNDIAIVKGISVANAEKIKIESGCCWYDGINVDSEVIIPGVGGRAPEATTKSQICSIIQPRMEEIFTMVRKAVMQNSQIKQLSGNIILTGGGALMEGVVELAQAIFRTSSVRIGTPENLGGVEEDYRTPDFATAVGLIIANKAEDKKSASRQRRKARTNSTSVQKKSGVKEFFKRFF
ncbi:MAG: cell division protein FtsA [Treponema sp.]|nr:cell division protein FtsA [Treponema sp.]